MFSCLEDLILCASATASSDFEMTRTLCSVTNSRLPSSTAATRVVIFASPRPAICWSTSRFCFSRVLICFATSRAISDTERCLLPEPSSIIISSLMESVDGPRSSNFSRGRRWGGRCFIVITNGKWRVANYYRL